MKRYESERKIIRRRKKQAKYLGTRYGHRKNAVELPPVIRIEWDYDILRKLNIRRRIVERDTRERLKEFHEPPHWWDLAIAESWLNQDW